MRNVKGITGTLADQGRTVMSAAAAGKITPSQASALLGSLSSLARIVEVSELEQRVAALEGASKTGARA